MSDKKALKLEVGEVVNPEVQKDRDGFEIGKRHRITWVGTGASKDCQFDGTEGNSITVALPEGTETMTVKGEKFYVTKNGLELAPELEKPFTPPDIHPGTGLPNEKERAESAARNAERRDVVDTGKTRADSEAAAAAAAAAKRAEAAKADAEGIPTAREKLLHREPEHPAIHRPAEPPKGPKER